MTYYYFQPNFYRPFRNLNDTAFTRQIRVPYRENAQENIIASPGKNLLRNKGKATYLCIHKAPETYKHVLDQSSTCRSSPDNKSNSSVRSVVYEARRSEHKH